MTEHVAAFCDKGNFFRAVSCLLAIIAASLMAVETKPLFNPELVRREVHAFTLPESAESALPRLQHWADLISSGKADTLDEVQLMWATAPPRMPF